LRRIWSGPFEVEDAIDFALIENSGPANTELDQFLMPQTGLDSLPEQKIKPEAAGRLRSGNAVEIAHTELEFGDECWASLDGNAAGRIAPSRVFVTDKT